MFWRRIRYSSRSSGPSNVSRKTPSASGGMYRSRGISFIASPYTPASGFGSGDGCARSSAASTLVITQAHRLADVAHRFLGELARALAAVGDDVANERRVVEIALRTLANRRLLADDRVDDRLLAFEAADAGGRAASDHPVAGLVRRVDLVQPPHRALLRAARIGSPDARWIGLHRPDLFGDRRGILPQHDRVAVRLGHLLAVEARNAWRFRQQWLRFRQDHSARAFEVAEQPFPVTERQVLRVLEQLARGFERLAIALLP